MYVDEVKSDFNMAWFSLQLTLNSLERDHTFVNRLLG